MSTSSHRESPLLKSLVGLTLLAILAASCTPNTGVDVPDAKIQSEKSSADAESGETDQAEDFPNEDVPSENSDTPIVDMPVAEEPDTMKDPDAIVKEPDESMKPADPIVVVPKPDPDPDKEPEEMLVVANGNYLIRSVHSQRCLDIPAAQKTNGLGLEIYDCAPTPSAAQVFELKHVGNKFYQIKNVSTGKSLEVRGQVLAQERLIQQGDYVGGAYQQFEFQPQSDGTYVIKCKGANLVFDVSGARVDNKTPIQIWPPNNFVNERFTLTPLQ